MATPAPDAADENTAILCVVENAVEAQIIADALSQNDIACTVDRSHDTAYDGLFEATKGWGSVIVLERDLERAREVLADFEDTQESRT